MKRAFLPAIGFLALGTSLGSAFDFVRQTQVINGVTVVSDMEATNSIGQVTATGEVESDPLTATASIFQLWASYTKADNTVAIVKLDEKTVGTFLPTVAIATSSEDPYVPTCTRADRPYTLSVTVSGLLAGASDPAYSKSVLLKRGYKVYSPVTYAPTGETGEYTSLQSSCPNGTSTTTVVQQLPAAVPTLAMGSETFSAWIQPDAGSTLGQLASAEVTVWPVASSTINGIESDKCYMGLPNSGTMTLVNAYPRSRTYAQIYKGAASLGTVGTEIPNTVTTYGSGPDAPTAPQNTTVSTISLESISDKLQDDGVYTIEVLTVTPFNGGAPERLAYVSFSINRTISVNSMVTTIE